MTPEEHTTFRKNYESSATLGVYCGAISALGGLATCGFVTVGLHEYYTHGTLDQKTLEPFDCHVALTGLWLGETVGLACLLAGTLMFGISKHFFTLDKKGYFGK